MGTVAFIHTSYYANMGLRSIIGSLLALTLVFSIYSLLPKTKNIAVTTYVLVSSLMFFGSLILLTILLTIQSGSTI